MHKYYMQLPTNKGPQFAIDLYTYHKLKIRKKQRPGILKPHDISSSSGHLLTTMHIITGITNLKVTEGKGKVLECVHHSAKLSRSWPRS
jgi:hypothetical protein